MWSPREWREIVLIWSRTLKVLSREVSQSSPDADADAQPLDRDRKVHQSELTGVAGGRDLTALQIDRSKCADHARELPQAHTEPTNPSRKCSYDQVRTAYRGTAQQMFQPAQGMAECRGAGGAIHLLSA